MDVTDSAKAKSWLQWSVFGTMVHLADYADDARLTSEQRRSANALAEEWLNYLVSRRSEIDPKYLDPKYDLTKRALIGMRQLLSNPEDVARLSQFRTEVFGKEGIE